MEAPVCTNVTRSNFQSLSFEGIITPTNLGFLDLLPFTIHSSSHVCVCVRFFFFFFFLSTTAQEICVYMYCMYVCVCMCVLVLLPIRCELAEQIDTALGFFGDL